MHKHSGFQLQNYYIRHAPSVPVGFRISYRIYHPFPTWLLRHPKLTVVACPRNTLPCRPGKLERVCKQQYRTQYCVPEKRAQGNTVREHSRKLQRVETTLICLSGWVREDVSTSMHRCATFSCPLAGRKSSFFLSFSLSLSLSLSLERWMETRAICSGRGSVLTLILKIERKSG